MLKPGIKCAVALVIFSLPLLAANARKENYSPVRKGKKGILAAEEKPVRPSKSNLKTAKQKAAAEELRLSASDNKKLAALNPKAKQKMKAALDDMREAGLCPMITSSYRSNAEQREIYHCAHRHQCKVKRGIFSARKPGTSLHEAGLAVDFADVANGKKRHRQLTRDGQKMVKIMQRHGFKWRYGLKDPAHFELEPSAAGFRSEQAAIRVAQIKELQQQRLHRLALRKAKHTSRHHRRHR